MNRTLRIVAALVVLASPAGASVELYLYFSALQRMLASQLFTQDGRKYVKGNAADHCSFAFLEKPRVGVEQNKLYVLARFSGRSAVDVFGKCVGLGDSFDVVIYATPYYRKGALAFQDVVVNTVGKESFYKSRVRRAMTRALENDITYPLEKEAKVLLEQEKANPGYRQELSNFDVAAIRVTGNAVVLVVDFRLAVK